MTDLKPQRTIAKIDRSARREKPETNIAATYCNLKEELVKLSQRNNEIRRHLTISRQRSFDSYLQVANYKKASGKNVTDRLISLLEEGADNSSRIFELNNELRTLRPHLPKSKRIFSEFFVDVVKQMVDEDVFNDLCKKARELEMKQ